ncbi:TIGR02301 family protein [Mycoplana rhizolycopersici]|uniref:TIGR02301 family protein n=1 Tax=Mycoplana rhizolycopersici TaxID=2746702 RepID=A0ABX2Q994_9HYPH|nr:TIGR02301 family protein [Rhizobium rhizolycopersici]NVP54307.1 TIGR02301 family protein [Rhizobium rhizolycopersici]
MSPVARLVFLVTLAAACPAAAQTAAPAAPATKTAAPPAENKPALYDGRLERLSEILGAVHYLRNLCLKDGEDSWRKAMEDLISMEAGSEAYRKERLTAAFNRGYRSFASVYSSCTDQAVVAEERYRIEGATLATEITARFGN